MMTEVFTNDALMQVDDDPKPTDHDLALNDHGLEATDDDLASTDHDAIPVSAHPAPSDHDLACVGTRDAEELDQWRRNSGTRSRGGQPGNTNNLQHGIFANRFLTPEEKPVFDAIIAQLHEDFVFNKSSDFIQVELVAVYFLKLGRAQEAGDWDAAERLDRMIRCHMRDLKTTKISREGTEAKGDETTPAEWATALLEKLAAAEKSNNKASEEDKV